MSKTTDNFYFNNFIESIQISCNAAYKLKEILINFDGTTLKKSFDEIHVIEHMGDIKKHEMTSEIVKAFITPIDRDDIVEISESIDKVTDSIEDIILGLYTFNITSMRNNAITFADVIINCCESTKLLLEELPCYKKSKLINDAIIKINQLEEEGDKLYISYVRKLFETPGDPLLVMSWREIYRSFEHVCDACEDVADVIESIIIANT